MNLQAKTKIRIIFGVYVITAAVIVFLIVSLL